MDLKIAWWNCHLTAPSTKAKPNEMTPEFFLVILSLLSSGVDLLCLCEVNEKNCVELAKFIISVSQQKPEYAGFAVRSMYSKDGNKIDDFGVVYRVDKLTLEGDGTPLNVSADVTEKFLKVGRKLDFKLRGGKQLWVILSHWQSLMNYSEDSHVRTEVGIALRGYVHEIFHDDPNALIVICGDFNDEPFSRSIQLGLKASRDISYVKMRKTALFNPFWRVVGTTDLVAGGHLPAGTCLNSDSQHMTNWRTFDQIILSSGFLQDDWKFVGNGAEIMSSINLEDSMLSWSDISDHYPIMCSLQKVV